MNNDLPKVLNSSILRKIAQFYSAKHITDSGFTRENIYARAVSITWRMALTALLLYAVLFWMSFFCGEYIGIELNSDLYFTCFGGAVAAFWATYIALNAEFVSKYKDLLQRHSKFMDMLFAKSRKIDDGRIFYELLHIADDCRQYGLHDNRSFKWTFDLAIAYLIELKEKDNVLFENIIKPFPDLGDYLEGVVSSSEALGIFELRECFNKLPTVKLHVVNDAVTKMFEVVGNVAAAEAEADENSTGTHGTQ